MCLLSLLYTSNFLDTDSYQKLIIKKIFIIQN